VSPAEEGLGSAQALVAMLLLGASLVALPRALARGRSAFGKDTRAIVIAAALAALVLRCLVAPHEIATVFIGYRWTEQCWYLHPIPAYGAGAAALYHALFALLPFDHASILWVNALLGALAVPLAASLASRLSRDPKTGAVAAVLVAILPIFVRNDASDANNVPLIAWMLGGLVLLEEHLDRARAASRPRPGESGDVAAPPRGTRSHGSAGSAGGADRGERTPLALGTALLALAACSRPEAPIVVAAAAAAVVLASRPVREPRALAVAALCALVLVVPHALHVARAIGELEDRDSLPGLRLGLVPQIPFLLVARNAVLDPTLFPIGVAGLAALALWKRGAGRMRWMWLPLLVAVVAYLPDLDRANVARVHVPAALFATLLAARGATLLWSLEPRAAMRAAAAGAVLISIAPSAIQLFRPTNEATEESVIREAERSLGAEHGYTLVRTAFADRPEDDRHTHEHFPDYLFRPPAGGARVVSVTDFASAPDFSRPVYFYWGMRCHARFRHEGTRAPGGENLQPHCARMRERFLFHPVFERTVPNRGDVWIDYYGDAPSLTLGLYRIAPRAEPPSPRPPTAR
jgi:hypothetical protein